jgi:hypothetical protein
MRITAPQVLIHGNKTDIGLMARPNRNGFIAVDVGLGADPETFTDDLVAEEQAGMPGWRWRKEYLRDWGAQTGQPVFDNLWLAAQRQIRDPAASPLSPSGLEGLRRWVLPDSLPKELPKGSISAVRQFGIGVDVSEGVGASDSTIQVFTVDTREQAACFADNRIHPPDLARLIEKVARYYNNALVCIVRKMHGITVIRTLVDECRYAMVWRTKVLTKPTIQNAADLGWPGGEASSPFLFGDWVDQIQYEKTTLHDITTLDQHRQYIYDERGRITHQILAELPPDVRERHGDLVVACALAHLACKDSPKYSRPKGAAGPPVGSMAWFEEQDRLERERKEEW